MKKTQKDPETLTINGISLRHKLDRRTLAKYLAGFPPAKVSRGIKYFNVAEAIRHVEIQMATVHKASPAVVELRQQKIFEEVRKLRFENDEKASLVVSRAAVSGSINRTAQAIRTLLESKLENEYPSIVVGLDLCGIRVKGRQLGDAILTEMQNFADFWEI